jgi:predicted dienelactone hydrolase
LAIGGQLVAPQAAAANDKAAQNLRVGHKVEHMTVPGSAKSESREVDVHLWYPADATRYLDAPKSHYASTLYSNLELLPPGALSWTIRAEVARENAPIDQSGPPFPVILFSHGSTNDPIDYAHTLELIAARGFVVAAPYHVNNTQDDVRIDFINPSLNPLYRIPCNDGLPSPCSRPAVAFSMADRVHDISHVLDNLDKDKPAHWPLADRVDVSRAGVLGHSRGTVTALAAAGGSVAWSKHVNCEPEATHGDLCWPLAADTRVQAIMGLAIGGPAITDKVDLRSVRAPALLVAGDKDVNSFPQISEQAFDKIESEDKAFIRIPNAVHRSFDSTYCDQAQAAGASADTNHNGVVDVVQSSEVADWKNKAILDRHTLTGILSSPASGKAVEYCSPETFTTPVDIRPLVEDLTGFKVECVTQDQATGRCLKYNVPTTGLDTDEVKQGVTQLAATFFGTVLKRVGNDGPHFTRYLAPKWLAKHEPMIGTAEALASSNDAICPPGQDVICGD